MLFGKKIVLLLDNSPTIAAGFTPPSGLQLWLQNGVGQYSDVGKTTPSVNTGVVYWWNDQSGVGNHVQQASGVSQPSQRTGLVNGKTAVRFNGTSHYLSNSTFTPVGATVHTLFAVVSNATATANSTLLDGGTRRQLGARSTGWEMYQGGAGVIGNVAVNASPHILTGVFLGTASSTIYVDGINGVTGDAGSAAVDAILYVGGRTSIEFFNGDIYEVLWFNRQLSGPEITTVQRYLGTLYGITVP